MLKKCNNCFRTHDIIVKGEEFIPSNNEYFGNNGELKHYSTQIATRIMKNIHYKCIDCNNNNIIEKELL